MKCPRCLNTDKSYFYQGKRGIYCRKCISFSRIYLEESLNEVSLALPSNDSEEYTLQFPLTKKQKEISRECASLIDEGDILIHAVCGAGKTELVVETIAKLLKRKQKVCFAVPRRQVVLELAKRFKEIFKKAKVIAVCGGYTKELDGDLIVCTTHQLYRYYQAFDYLILDEPDAFPFYGNTVLHGIARTSCKANIIYLTATPDDNLRKRIKNKTIYYLTLNVRPHGYALPVPKVYYDTLFFNLIRLVYWLKKYKDKPRMIFVPTIAMTKSLHRFLSLFEKCFYCSSETENKDEIIEKFKSMKNGLCISTTILERGVTIPNVNVCVFEASHYVFSLASLIQMAGRVGRNYLYPTGSVIFLASQKSKKITDCIKEIERANSL